MLGPILEGPRIRLIPPAPEMLPIFLQWLADTEVTRYLGRENPLSLVEEQEWFDKVCRSDNQVFWAIMVGERLIGTTGIHAIDWRNRHAITGILLGEKEEWGKGYAPEAQTLRTRYAFESLGLEKLMTSAFMENNRSKRALEKVGYRPCGVFRRHIFRHGRWHDMWQAELLREEWTG